ncbi:MAG TPA: DUF805 domain-containing protein [Planctomycetota bacterium]|nr:DUF805 domain-containing protein [Planctomycetota bacterium]
MSSHNAPLATVGRLDYFLALVWLILLKHSIDWLLAKFVFHRSWSVLSYFLPSAISPADLSSPDTIFFLTLLVTSFPFVWLAVVLTSRRLRDVDLPRWLVALLFVPVVNLILLFLLIIIPGSDKRDAVEFRLPFDYVFEHVLPRSSVGTAGIAVLITAAGCVLVTMLSVELYELYGWGLFVGLPFMMGLTSALIFAVNTRRSASSCQMVAIGSLALGFQALIFTGFEGAICLIMAAPLAVPLAMLGGAVAYFLQNLFHDADRGSERWIGVFFALPLTISIERAAAPEPPLFEVSSEIVIDAEPYDVWQNVVSFSDLPEEREWIFHLGLAYPIRAEIDSCGVGATRYCVFNTGAFVEPIEVWDEPRLLKFSVTECPAPMHEWSPYDIHPPHLHGFLESRAGQFKLIELPDGKTKLVGTTWYQHTMWPAAYWQTWSDWIIHRIHMRVLTHIKVLSERGETGSQSNGRGIASRQPHSCSSGRGCYGTR